MAPKLKAPPGFADYAMPSVSQSLQVSNSSTPRSYLNVTSRQLRCLGAEPPGHRPILINEYAEREQVHHNQKMQFDGFVLWRFEGDKIAERWATVTQPAEGAE